MKTYQLNENWSSFSVGDRFKLSTRGNGDLFQLINNSGDYVLAKIPTELLDEVGDDIWRPKDDETYYYCDEDGEVFSSKFYNGYAPHVPRYSFGNCFKTEEDAQAMAAWLRAKQQLIESGARFVNSSDVAVNDSKSYYKVYFTMNGNTLRVDDAYFSKDVARDKVMCFDDRGVALKSIEEHRGDWLTYLGVKEDGDGNS